MMRGDYQKAPNPPPPSRRGRARQRERTRQLILSAALKLIADGHVPTVEDAAAAADVSPATGYRYFSSQAALLGAAAGAAIPDEIAEAIRGRTAQERLDELLATGFPNLVETEALDRAILSLALGRWLGQRTGRRPHEPPLTRPGRKALVNEIVRPLRSELDDTSLKQLELGLGMVLGIESYVALSDIYEAEPGQIRETWRFACKAMIDAVAQRGGGG